MSDIKILGSQDEGRWDDYVLHTPNSTIFHSVSWKKAIEETYGHTSHYIYSKSSDGTLNGILPLFQVKNFFFRSRLISIPFAPYGGVCSDNPTVGQGLIEGMLEIKKNIGAEYCEVRQRGTIKDDDNKKAQADYSTFVLDLTKGSGHIWDSMDRKVRNMIRKGEKNGLIYHVDSSINSVTDFYRIYCDSMSRLGTPAHDIRFFQKVFKYCNNCSIAKVDYKGSMISALFLLNFKNTMISGWGASSTAHLKLSPNNYIYWKSIELACDKKINLFDFGRSLKGTGNYRFKEGWGAHICPLYYDHYPRYAGGKIPQYKYDRFSKIWRLLPLHMTTFIGPKLRRHIP
jgi:FemAB-related protein (PEP-CTERM system-associated)